MRQGHPRVSIHTGPQLKGSLSCYLSTVRVPRPFKEVWGLFTGQDVPSMCGAGGNVFGKQSGCRVAEFLTRSVGGSGGLWVLILGDKMVNTNFNRLSSIRRWD